MKNIVFFLAVFFYANHFCSKQKNLVREINNYKVNIYTTSQYKTDAEQLSAALTFLSCSNNNLSSLDVNVVGLPDGYYTLISVSTKKIMINR